VQRGPDPGFIQCDTIMSIPGSPAFFAGDGSGGRGGHGRSTLERATHTRVKDAHRSFPEEAESRVTTHTDHESGAQIIFVPTGGTYGAVPTPRTGPRWIVYGPLLGGYRQYHGTFTSPDVAATEHQKLTRLSDKEQEKIVALHQERARRYEETRLQLNKPPPRIREPRDGAGRNPLYDK